MQAVVEISDKSFNSYWSEIFANDPVQHPFYSQSSSDTPARADAYSRFEDRSFVVVSEDQPVFACSLTIHTDEAGHTCLGYFGLEASSHINRLSMQPPTHNFHQDAVHMVQEHINRLIEEVQPDRLEYLDPVCCGVMSPVTQLLLERGARPFVQTAKIVDLTLSGRELARRIRKSQRSMIQWGQRNLHIEIMSGNAFAQTDADTLAQIFEQAIASGDASCSSLTRYEQLVRQGKAFMVRGDHAGVPVAAALIAHTARTCHYVLGSTAKSAPDQPVMPALIWSALLHGKSLGCARFEMGRLAQSDSATCERSRLLNSFGGDSQTRLKVCLVP